MARYIRYFGFAVDGDFREYTFAVRGTDAEATWHDVGILIAHQAFLERRLRYQDAPDLCFRILREAVEGDEGWKPPPLFVVGEKELLEYSASTAPRRPRHRSRATAEIRDEHPDRLPISSAED